MLDYESWFTDFPPELATVLIGMLPIAELRGAIPVALGAYDLPIFDGVLYSIIGNLVPVIAILLFLDPVARFLSKHSKIMKRFFDWLFERTRRKFTARYQKWGALALILFVAIPLPVTGGYTGSVAAFLFGIPFKVAFPLIFLGILIAATIVTLITVGVIAL